MPKPMDKRIEDPGATDLLVSLNCYKDAVRYRDYVGVAHGPRYLENCTDAAAVEIYVDQRLKAMRDRRVAEAHAAGRAEMAAEVRRIVKIEGGAVALKWGTKSAVRMQTTPTTRRCTLRDWDALQEETAESEYDDHWYVTIGRRYDRQERLDR